MALILGKNEISNLKLGRNDVVAVYKGNTLVSGAAKTPNCFNFCNRSNDPATICFNIIGNLSTVPVIEYSYNESEWTPYNFGEEIELEGNWTKCYFRGNNNSFSESTTNYITASINGSIHLEGNIMSLLDKRNKRTSIPNWYCFYKLFYNCAAIEGVGYDLLSEITSLRPFCYSYMFAGCTNLMNLCNLTATELSQECYSHMFEGCTSVTSSVSLPDSDSITATYMKSCFEMFKDCINIQTATIRLNNDSALGSDCFGGLFKNCILLNDISLGKRFTDDLTESYFYNWVVGVSETGTFRYAGENYTFGTSGIPTGWKTWTYFPLYFKAVNNNTNIAFNIVGNLSPRPTLQYSFDRETWIDYSFGTEENPNYITLNANQRCYWGGDYNTTFSKSASNYVHFVADNYINSGGNIMSLYDKDTDYTTLSSASQQYYFTKLFLNCNNLITPPNLCLTRVQTRSLDHMFSGCTSLIQVPNMFITSTATYWAVEMFSGCTSLTDASKIEISTTAGSGCYRMFSECTALTTSAIIKAISTTNDTYREMFYHCSSLNILLLDTTAVPNNTCNNGWLQGVAETGIAYYAGDASAIISRGPSSIPVGWEIVPYSERE